MRPMLRSPWTLLPGLVPVLLCGCTMGGWNSPRERLAINSPPAVTAPMANPADANLIQYKTYLFTTGATDPDLYDRVVSCVWDFGDGSPAEAVTAPPFSVQHAFLAAGAPVKVTVTARDTHGLNGPASSATFTVSAAANPFLVLPVAPAAPSTLQVPQGASVTVDFQFRVTYDGMGTVPNENFTLVPGSPLATANPGVKVMGTLDGGGAWTVSAVYPASGGAGTAYSVTPTLKVKDSLNIQSVPAVFPTLTIQTVARP
ncbi:PKD domain-containing protein [Mesoterricola silvestris]|uniref:PKD domain-containing protein n=1 Tax=Mesoterricola silvestris TaxID=2927979 RepID=A0AA48GLY2_9BACT|nr:PKD domain-containing protein [Mesoterricola silvestris]BDU73842.1 hypothetical protein METEAL_30160 [Mesoterricola silvestris]